MPILLIRKKNLSAVLEFENLSDIVSKAGQTLSLVGKQYKPKAKQKVEALKQKMQPPLI